MSEDGFTEAELYVGVFAPVYGRCARVLQVNIQVLDYILYKIQNDREPLPSDTSG